MRENGISVKEEFAAMEKKNRAKSVGRSGHVNKIQFKYVLNTFLDLDEEETLKITNFLHEKVRPATNNTK